MINLFIDTNIWLHLYSASADDLKHVREIQKLIGNEINLFIPEQVWNEFLRNRDNTIKYALNNFKYEASYPNFVRSYGEYEELKEIDDKLERKYKELFKKVKEDISNSVTPSDKTIYKFFKENKLLKLDGEIISKAKLRFDLGNPPGKNGSYGDAVNWEVLLRDVPFGEDLYFISDDNDYSSAIDTYKFNLYLGTEWYNKKNSKIIFYRTLNDFLKENFKDFELKEETERKMRINKLRNSRSFQTTHSVIQELRDFVDWTIEEKEELCKIATENNQVGSILFDYDVFTFYKSLNLKTSSENEYIRNIAKDLEQHEAVLNEWK